MFLAAATGTHTSAITAPGVAVDDLVGMAPVAFGALVERAYVAPAPRRVAVVATPAAKEVPGLRLDDLVVGGELSLGQLIHNASRPPQASRSSDVAIVAVTIPDTPEAEPVATLGAIPVPPRASTAAPDVLTLEITEAQGALRFSPQALVLPSAAARVRVVLGGAPSPAGLSIFVRDQTVVHFDQTAMELRAKQHGVTEVYAVQRGKMYIVPVTVEAVAGGGLTVPDALVSLDGVFSAPAALGSALHAGLSSATESTGGSAGAVAGGASADGPTLDTSLAETARTAREVQAEESRYSAEATELAFKPITVQVVDDRSVPAAGRIYPVPGAIVRLVGTEFAGRADATGHLTIRDVPAAARFFVRIDDDGGIVRPGMAELSSRPGHAGRVTRLKVIRNFSFDAYANLAGVVQHADLASYCATVLGDAGGDFAPLDGIAAASDAPGEGPFYFNRYGLLDRVLSATGPDGRVCFYNVEPGPMALTFYDDGAPLATLPAATYAGRHVDEDIPLGADARLTVRLAATGTAHEQLGIDVRAANSLKTIDMIDLIPLGTGEPMMQLAPGRVTTAGDLTPSGGRLMLFAQAAEFEPAIYTFDVAGQPGDVVTSLLPRGFVEDLSVYAQVAYNPELGAVLVEYGHPRDAGTVAVKLVDSNGREARDGWYFADEPVTKAMFFNVPAGVYAVLVETQDGFWLAADTTKVYNETVSYIRLGARVRYRP